MTEFQIIGSLAKVVWFTNNTTLLHAEGNTTSIVHTIKLRLCLIRSKSLFKIDKINRRFCRTDDGCLARVTDHAKIGDIIYILYGSQVPYVLRQQVDETYKVTGECYVHGMRLGEGLQVAARQRKIFRIC